MLLEEDVVMERNEELRLPARSTRDDDTLPLPVPAKEDDRQASDEQPHEQPPWAVSPPPMPWPRVFPGL